MGRTSAAAQPEDPGRIRLREQPAPVAAVRFQNVSKSFRARRRPTVEALRGIDLTLPEGTFTAIVGSSGCGKTTLLKIVAGLESATEGCVALSEGTRAQPPGMAFQRPVLLPWRTVLANVLLPVEVLKLPHREHLDSARELLDMAELGGWENARPAALSGGMQQRVALVRALVTRPALLLMDEPFAALDYLTRENLTTQLERLWLRDRPTTLFVTHSIAEAVFLADRVVVMSPRPGSIRAIVEVDAPRPRDWDVVSSGALAGVVSSIRHLIAQDDA